MPLFVHYRRLPIHVLHVTYLHGDGVWWLSCRLLVTVVDRRIVGRDSTEEPAAVLEFVDEMATPNGGHLQEMALLTCVAILQV